MSGAEAKGKMKRNNQWYISGGDAKDQRKRKHQRCTCQVQILRGRRRVVHGRCRCLEEGEEEESEVYVSGADAKRKRKKQRRTCQVQMLRGRGRVRCRCIEEKEAEESEVYLSGEDAKESLVPIGKRYSSLNSSSSLRAESEIQTGSRCWRSIV